MRRCPRSDDRGRPAARRRRTAPSDGPRRRDVTGEAPVRRRGCASAGSANADDADAIGARPAAAQVGSGRASRAHSARRDTKAHGFRGTEAGEPRLSRRARQAAHVFRQIASRKDRSAAGMKSRARRSDRAGATDAPVEARDGPQEQLRCAQAARPHRSTPRPRARARIRATSATRRLRRRCRTAPPLRGRDRRADRHGRRRTKPACGSTASSRRDFPVCRSATSSASSAKARCG